MKCTVSSILSQYEVYSKQHIVSIWSVQLTAYCVNMKCTVNNILCQYEVFSNQHIVSIWSVQYTAYCVNIKCTANSILYVYIHYNLLYYDNIKCLNDNLSVGASSWWWLSAAKSWNNGLMSWICIGVCKLLVLWTEIV